TFTDAGGYSVVWWDPGALTLDVKPTFGVRREDLIVKDVARNVIADGRTRYDAWLLSRADARVAGAAPSLNVETVREWAASDAEVTAVDIETVDVRAPQEIDRPSGAGFGLLVHEVLAQAPFGAERSDLDALAALAARLLGMATDDARAAAAVAARVLGH